MLKIKDTDLTDLISILTRLYLQNGAIEEVLILSKFINNILLKEYIAVYSKYYIN